MSEITINVPLDALAGAKTLDAAGIQEYLGNAVLLADTAKQAVNQYNSIINQFHSAAKSLQLILDEVDDPFEKAQALRRLAQEMQSLKFLEMPVPE